MIRRVGLGLGRPGALVGIAIAAMTAGLFVVDREAFYVLILLAPIFGTVLAAAIAARGTVLIVFAGFLFAGHGLGTAFFFLNRDAYSQSGGFGAIGSFQFSIGEILGVYRDVFIALGAMLIGSFGFAPLLPPRPTNRPPTIDAAPKRSRGGGVWSLALALFSFAIVVPLCFFMYGHRLGITGVISEVLPYRLTGILYYGRMFVVPVVLLAIYGRTRRGTFDAAIVLFTAVIAGLTAASRYQLLIDLTPVLLFALLDARSARFIVASAVAGVSFFLISLSRDFVYDGLDVSIWQLALLATRSWAAGGGSPLILIGGVLNRFYGAQDVVLAHGFDMTNRFDGIINFLRAKPPDVLMGLYGLNVPEGSGWGVAMGVVGWVVLLARHSFWLLVLLGLVLAAWLAAAEAAVRLFARFPAPLNGLSLPLAFFLTFDLLSGTLNWFYELLAYGFALIVVVHVVQGLSVIGRRSRSDAVTQVN